jgi:NADH-quinone oxidoreductase subunit F
VDLKLTTAAATDAERAAVDGVLGEPEGAWDGGERTASDGRIAVGGRGARARRDLLLPALHGLQDEIGWISPGGINYICERLTVPPADAYGVASFYAMFSLEPAPPLQISVCDDVICRGGGALDLCRSLEEAFGAERGTDGAVAWRRTPCLGQCDRPPAVLIQAAAEGRTAMVDGSIESIASAIAGTPPAEPDRVVATLGTPLLTRRIRTGGPGAVDAYRADGGYEALAIAVEHGPERVLADLEAAELRGRGGAAFPTAVKWRAVAGEPADPKYIVCNADESEPGTFKDRVVLEEDPFAVIEGMTLAGFVTGAAHGYVYIRGEYPLAEQRLHSAIDAARAGGLLGSDVLGAGFSFDIEIRRGAGAYICGEETALFNSIEGFRGEPRSKPPFPTQVGLFGGPTAINNVETFAAAIGIVAGLPGAAEAKIFSISGDVAQPGLYEAPFGVSVRDLIDAAGGVDGGGEPGAVLLGGAAGRFLAPADLDVALGYAPDAPPLGSGALMVFDRTTDMDDIVLRIAAFFREESCGQCVPCRVGTVRQEEALLRFIAGSDERIVLAEIAAVMRDASICGLGQFAAEAVGTAIAVGVMAGPGER